MATNTAKTLHAGTASLFNNENYHDIIIACEGQTWYAHKAIVCPRSAFFDKALNSDFKESREKRITLHGDDPSIVHEMLHYIYSAHYNDGQDPKQADAPKVSALTNVKVHTIADKYDVPGLAGLAVAKFDAYAVTYWESDDFAMAIKVMYTVAPDSKSELQQKALTITCANVEALFTKDGTLFCKVSEEIPKFASQLSAMLVKGRAFNQQGEVRYRCKVCQKEHVRTSMAAVGTHYCPFCTRYGNMNTFTVVTQY